MDTGAMQVRLKIDLVLKALHMTRNAYLKCLENASSDMCYVQAIGVLTWAFGLAASNVFHDRDFRFFAIRCADYNWLIVDAETGRYRLVSFSELIANSLEK